MKKNLLGIMFFIAVFVLNAQEKSLISQKPKAKTTKSTILPLRTQLKKTDIMKVISENIEKEFPGYTYEKAYKLETRKVVTYEVHVRNTESTLVLVYNKDGKFIKKEPVRKPEKKPEIKKTEDNKQPVQLKK